METQVRGRARYTLPAPLRGWSTRPHQVDRYDGEMLWIRGEVSYELGNYLGGGAAGVVYEAVDLKVR